MTITMTILVIAGLLAILAGNLMMLVEAFRVHWAWGVACMVLPPAMLLFMIMQWEKAQDGFYYIVFGAGLIFLSAFNFSTVSYDFKPHKQMYYQYYYQAMGMLGVPLPSYQSITPLSQTVQDPKSNGADKGINGIYTCVQANGNVTFTDKPCDTNEKVTIPEVNPKNPDEKVNSIRVD